VTWVVDASLAVTWVIPEVLSANADRIRDGEDDLALHATAPLLPRALAMARRLAHPVDDCVYLALAERERAALVTADERLPRAAAARRLGVAVVDLRAV
jgi:predicted nucleic acid-binding protein